MNKKIISEIPETNWIENEFDIWNNFSYKFKTSNNHEFGYWYIMHKSIVIQNHILNKVVPDNGKLRNIYQKIQSMSLLWQRSEITLIFLIN